MRKRQVSPDFFLDEDLAKLPAHTRLFFEGLWCIADREGRFEWRPVKLRAQVFPYEPELDCAAMLDKLVEGGWVVRYEADGHTYGAVRSFHKHQPIHPQEAKSRIPAPSTEKPANQHPTSLDVIRPPLDVSESTPTVQGLRSLKPSVTQDLQKRARPSAGGLFADVIGVFSAAWAETHGRSYFVTAPDRKAFGRLLSGMTPTDTAELPGMFRRYFASGDDFAAKQGFSLVEFCRTVNRWRANGHMSLGLDAKSSGTAAALQRFVERGKQ